MIRNHLKEFFFSWRSSLFVLLWHCLEFSISQLLPHFVTFIKYKTLFGLKASTFICALYTRLNQRKTSEIPRAIIIITIMAVVKNKIKLKLIKSTADKKKRDLRIVFSPRNYRAVGPHYQSHSHLVNNNKAQMLDFYVPHSFFFFVWDWVKMYSLCALTCTAQRCLPSARLRAIWARPQRRHACMPQAPPWQINETYNLAQLSQHTWG